MSILAQVQAIVSWDWLDGVRDKANTRWEKLLTEGEGDGQIEAIWHEEGVALANGATRLLDLSDLVRIILGDENSQTFTEIKVIFIKVTNVTAGHLIVGNAPYDVWQGPFGTDFDTISVPLNSPLLLVNWGEGWPVTTEGGSSSSGVGGGESGASRMLQLQADAGDVTYDIVVIGTTAPAVTSSSSSSSSGV